MALVYNTITPDKTWVQWMANLAVITLGQLLRIENGQTQAPAKDWRARYTFEREADDAIITNGLPTDTFRVRVTLEIVNGANNVIGGPESFFTETMVDNSTIDPLTQNRMLSALATIYNAV